MAVWYPVDSWKTTSERKRRRGEHRRRRRCYMMCCTRYCAAEALFNSKMAKRDLRCYRRRGPDATTRLMLAEIRRLPLEGQHLLDVGGGIGSSLVSLPTAV